MFGVEADPDTREIGECDIRPNGRRSINLDREVAKVKCGGENSAKSGAVGSTLVVAGMCKSDRVGSEEAENRSEVAFHLDHDIISKDKSLIWVHGPRIAAEYAEGSLLSE